MAKIHTPETWADFPLSLITNMVALATSGFGVVVALAWNNLIQATVTTYITPYLGNNSSLVALALYAIVVTVLAIIVTTQLTSLEKKFTILNETKLRRRAAARKAK